MDGLIGGLDRWKDGWNKYGIAEGLLNRVESHNNIHFIFPLFPQRKTREEGCLKSQGAPLPPYIQRLKVLN